MKTTLSAFAAASLLISAIPAQADQQCSYIGQQVVCRDMPSYRDAQIDARIPMMNNGSVVNYRAPIAMYQPMGNEAAAAAGAAVIVGSVVRGVGSLVGGAYDGIKSALSSDEKKYRDLLDKRSDLLIQQIVHAMPPGDPSVQVFKDGRSKITDLSMARYRSDEKVMPAELVEEYRQALDSQSNVFMRAFELYDRNHGVYSLDKMRQYRDGLNLQTEQAVRIFAQVDSRDKQAEYQTAMLDGLKQKLSQ